jgi:plasmid stabilization system protein ParE
MTYTIVSRSEVYSEILEVVQYYKSINPKLAKQFILRIREAKSFILLSPMGFQIKYKETRTLLLKQFPYHIHYIIDDKKQQIVILAIIHAYRNPSDSQKR